MIYKMYAGLSTGDGIASLDIQDNGILYAVHMMMCPTGLDALNDKGALEVSFMSSNTFLTNDTRGSILQTCVNQNFLTTGGGISGGVATMSGLLIPVNQGERIFLHGEVTAGGGGTCTVYLFVDDGSKVDKLRPPSRRR